MKYSNILKASVLAMTILWVACTKEDYSPNSPKNMANLNGQHRKKSAIAQPSEGLTVLGSQMEDP